MWAEVDAPTRQRLRGRVGDICRWEFPVLLHVAVERESDDFEIVPAAGGHADSRNDWGLHENETAVAAKCRRRDEPLGPPSLRPLVDTDLQVIAFAEVDTGNRRSLVGPIERRKVDRG